MRILLVASELNPLAKVGGLGDVIGALPACLSELGHDVRVVIPQYGCIDKYRLNSSIRGTYDVDTEYFAEKAVLNEVDFNRTRIYLIENHKYFGDDQVYTGNDLERFLFFSKAVHQLLPYLGWQPEVIHCNDWQTAMLVKWLKNTGYPGAVIFTIHNLAYQGPFDNTFLNQTGLYREWNYSLSGMPEIPLNFMSQGILWADIVTTVSNTYAGEILTSEQGVGLENLLRYRQSELYGIINGIDYNEYDPANDPYIPEKYDSNSLYKRAINKRVLQGYSGLTADPELPVIGMVQRLDEQKGFDILEGAIPHILDSGAQLVILGTGREKYKDMLLEISGKYIGRMSFNFVFNPSIAHLIYSGSDMFLMPSRFEPCGLGQLIAMRYGAIPIVRHTGGLVDTVPEFTDDLKENNGFVFHEYSTGSLIKTVDRALHCYREKKNAWTRAAGRIMEIDFSWRSPATRYEALYLKALANKLSYSQLV